MFGVDDQPRRDDRYRAMTLILPIPTVDVGSRLLDIAVTAEINNDAQGEGGSREMKSGRPLDMIAVGPHQASSVTTVAPIAWAARIASLVSLSTALVQSVVIGPG